MPAGLIQTSLIWVTYAVAVGLAVVVASVTAFTWQTPHERSPLVTAVVVVSLTSLLATVFLLPVDIALISSTADTSLGVKKDWATPEHVQDLLLTLQIVYYSLYGFDALLCLLVIPFAYFWYEEHDDDFDDDFDNFQNERHAGAANHEPRSAPARRPSATAHFLNALKYTLGFLALVVILFLIGFFLPRGATGGGGDGDSNNKPHLDLDYFRRLLGENRGERALEFSVGLLTCLGAILYALYTGAGMALLPVSLIKSAPSISAPQLSADTVTALERNRERQRQLELRNAGRGNGNNGGANNKDLRELQALRREERTLMRLERLAAESRGEGRRLGVFMRAWTKLCAVLRPLKLMLGIVVVLAALVVWASMLITGIDKIVHSACGARCGYILGHVTLFQPMNWIFVQAARVFPVDYALMALLVLLLFGATMSGIANIGIRFLWVRIFRIRKGRTAPQALLIATVMLALAVLAINYTVAMMVAPQYATYGTQTFCAYYPPGRNVSDGPDCSNHRDLVRPCSEALLDKEAAGVCTPSVVTTFLNRVTLDWPVFGAIDFWSQFAFLAVFLIVFVTALFRTPRLDLAEIDEDAEADEEEGLLASTGRRFGASWQDITGRARSKQQSRQPGSTDNGAGGYGTASAS